MEKTSSVCATQCSFCTEYFKAMAVYKLKWYSLKELTVYYTHSAQHIRICTVDVNAAYQKRQITHSVRQHTSRCNHRFIYYIGMSNSLQVNRFNMSLHVCGDHYATNMFIVKCCTAVS